MILGPGTVFTKHQAANLIAAADSFVPISKGLPSFLLFTIGTRSCIGSGRWLPAGPDLGSMEKAFACKDSILPFHYEGIVHEKQTPGRSGSFNQRLDSDRLMLVKAMPVKAHA